MSFFVKNNIFFIALALLFTFLFTKDANAIIKLSNSKRVTLDFGKTVLPSAGAVKIRVRRNGNLGAGATTATMLDTSISRGEEEISETSRAFENNNVAIDIEYDECAGNSSMGLTIDRFRSTYGSTNFNNNGYGLDNPGKDGTMLYYGADLTISSTASLGQLNPCYILTVSYNFQ